MRCRIRRTQIKNSIPRVHRGSRRRQNVSLTRTVSQAEKHPLRPPLPASVPPCAIPLYVNPVAVQSLQTALRCRGPSGAAAGFCPVVPRTTYLPQARFQPLALLAEIARTFQRLAILAIGQQQMNPAIDFIDDRMDRAIAKDHVEAARMRTAETERGRLSNGILAECSRQDHHPSPVRIETPEKERLAGGKVKLVD